ncbi:hypothetical protein [Nocardiopsis alba]|uniref:hypothetical protein n=1 Tax=Nocardiopsis alba TaxID=53437 RepID=UPI0035DC10A3
MTIRPYLGHGAASPILGDPIRRRAYVEDARRLVRDAEGHEVVSETTVYLAPGVEVAPESEVTTPTRTARVITSATLDHPRAPSHVVLALT